MLYAVLTVPSAEAIKRLTLRLFTFHYCGNGCVVQKQPTNVTLMMHLHAAKQILSLKTPVGAGPVLLEWQSHDGSLWAVSGTSRTVQVYDHFGNHKATLNLSGNCTGLGWDNEGVNLAAISDATSYIHIWNSNTLKAEKIETSLRDPLSFLTWGKSGMFLAIGTTKGNILIYNQRAGRKIPILGKHTKRITTGAWSSDNLLALGSEDKSISISTLEGDTVHSASLRSEPLQIQFSEMKQNERTIFESTVSAVIGRRTLILININDFDNPIELAFQPTYGNITTYRWFGDGYILIGFTGGYCIAISTHLKEIGQELFQIRNHRDKVTSIAINPVLNRAACAGDNSVRIYNLHDLKEAPSVITLEDENRAESCGFSSDGRLLAVTGTSGSVHLYLTRLNMLSAVWQPLGLIAVLTSLKEITLYDSALDLLCEIQCELEPVFLACGPKAVTVGLNNHVWLYDAHDGRPMRRLQFVGSVESVSLNDSHVAALVNGKVYLQAIPFIEPSLKDGNSAMDSGIFPLRDSATSRITSHSLSKDNLIYATNEGDIVYFSLTDRKPVSEYRHAVGWKKIYYDASGTLLGAVDCKGHGYLYSPVKEILLRIPDFPSHHRGIIWESGRRSCNIFVAWNDEKLDVYVFHPDRLTGSSIIRLTTIAIASGQIPLLLQGSELTLLTSSSKLTTVNIPQLGLEPNARLSSMSREELLNALEFSLAMGKYDDAWSVCILVNEEDIWLETAKAALNDFNVKFATRIYRHLEDIAMVWSLEEIEDVEDLHLLSGCICMLLGNIGKARDFYLKSSHPEVAIDMHTDVMEWEQALLLAEKLAPDRVGAIAREYAIQLEQSGDYVHALLNFERGLSRGGTVDNEEEHRRVCLAGIARSAVGSGDIRKGIAQALEMNDSTLLKQCASILEDNKNYLEAAELFEMAGKYDQAALLYSRMKNWSQVSKLIQHVTQSKVHIAYAKAKELQGHYKEALHSYELAGDFESAILICLNNLQSPQEAIRIARRTNSTEGAKLIGKYFMDMGDHTTALEYLVMSKNYETAFDVARQNGQVQLYADILGDQAHQEDYIKIAQHYEKERNFLLAGKYHTLAAQHGKAFKFFIKAAQNGSDEEKAINAAIHVVSVSQDDHLATQLVSFLNGEVDNIPKDGKYLFRFYLARKQYKEATKTALIIAAEGQRAGNYRDAHNLLQHMYRELSNHDISIPLEMERNLQLLHSYVIVRLHIRLGRHLNAARLLLRVADSISRFPAHVVPILTSTVIECDRAGLKQAAFQYAVVLMRTENREQLDLKYKKKLESIVRRPPKGTVDPEDDLTCCPFCSAPVPSTALLCLQCKQPLPMCIVTGMHIVKTDLTTCPGCKFFAMRSEFIKLSEIGEPCPMCSHKLSSATELKPFTEPLQSNIA